ncbi:OmpA family protein [Streptomyces sp. NPDC013953]|uniref:OmpA family protein n=1 Tax=Streptomyces sp. NPDC013953 TaxID=3364868 RepID=UPI0037021C96
MRLSSGRTSGRLLPFALALIAVVTSGGCGAFETPEQRPCAWLDGPPGEAVAGGPRTVVLVDRSPSARPGRATAAGVRAPDWAMTALAAPGLALPELEGGSLSVAGFDGTRAAIDWDVNNAFVSPVKGNGLRKKDGRGVAHRCVEDRLRQVAAAAPGTGRTDVLGALAAAAEQLGPADGGRRRIVVATDGLSNTGCADLRSAGFDGTAEIEARVQRCRTAGELPDLTGAEVSLVGTGRAVTGRAPSSPQADWLVRLWTRLCEASGAERCRVTTTARVQEAGSGTRTGKAEPAVVFPAVSERPAGKVTTIALPGSILFATDRAELTPQAQGTLDTAARRIKELDPLSVAVSGHTDSRGTEARGEELSLARARAVRSALARRGVAVASAEGHSDHRPSCSPEYRDGEPDHAAMACNRRVEIAVTVRR